MCKDDRLLAVFSYICLTPIFLSFSRAWAQHRPGVHPDPLQWVRLDLVNGPHQPDVQRPGDLHLPVEAGAQGLLPEDLGGAPEDHEARPA